MKPRGIALICGLALFLGGLAFAESSAYAESSSRIVFAEENSLGQGRLNFISPTGRELERIKLPRSPVALSASDNGRYIAVLPPDEFEAPEDGFYYSAFVYTAGEPKPRRVEIGFGSRTIGAAPSLAISPDGHLLAFSAGARIRVINLDTGRRWTLRKPHGLDFQPSFSSDGSHLVFVHSDTGCCPLNSDIFTIAIYGSSVHRLTDSPGEEEFFPEISPDGRHLAFLRRIAQGFELVVKRIGSDHEQVIRPVNCLLSRPDFSPDGKRIVYAWAKSRECLFFEQRMTLFTVGIDGRETHAVAQGIPSESLLPQWTRRPSG